MTEHARALSSARDAAYTDSASIPARIAALQVLLCVIWGATQVATKIGNAGISPIWHAGLRSAGAGLLVLAWIMLRRVPMHWRDGTGWAGLGIGLLFAMEFVCLYLGINYTTAARATMLQYTAPFFVALGAHLLVPADRLTVRKAIGLLAAFAGVLIVFYDRDSVPSGDTLIGDLLCLGGAAFWAGTTVMVKATRLRSAPPEKTLLYQLVVSAFFLLGVSWLIDEPGVFAPTPTIWLLLVYQICVIASVTYLVWFWLVSRYRASALSTFTFLTPVFGVFFAWLVLGEPVGPILLVSLALIATGIVLVNRG